MFRLGPYLAGVALNIIGVMNIAFGISRLAPRGDGIIPASLPLLTAVGQIGLGLSVIVTACVVIARSWPSPSTD